MNATAPTQEIATHEVVSKDRWLKARTELLAKEKELTHLRDELSRQRRSLPWVKVTKNYVFNGPNGKVTLSDLFGNRSQLFVYHFMLGPAWEEGCKGCSFFSDHVDGALIHLAHRDVNFVAISRAPYDKIAKFKDRMGWHFNWVSSFGNDFNFDYNVSFTKEQLTSGKTIYNYGTQAFTADEAPGASVFYKDADGNIYHTYSTFGRGLDTFIGTYNFLDLVPKGRDEDHYAMPMAWLRHHDRYDNYSVDPNAPFEHPKVETPKAEAKCCSSAEHQS